jgi:hypothetical protein
MALGCVFMSPGIWNEELDGAESVTSSTYMFQLFKFMTQVPYPAQLFALMKSILKLLLQFQAPFMVMSTPFPLCSIQQWLESGNHVSPPSHVT